jgi:carboxynorspermidine decarboxylase
VGAVEKRFPKLIEQVDWINMGGGHHISRSDYDLERLIRVLKTFKARWGKEHVYLEPGEAVGLNTGYLIAEVQDIVPTNPPTAILDLSASAHMPDTMEMPYRPHIFGGGMPGEFAHEYKMGGMTCLAGDVLSGFSFPQPLEIGQRLVFSDMAHYTMVKTTTFNGVHHPDIAIYDPAKKEYRVVRRFRYEDFRDKLS